MARISRFRLSDEKLEKIFDLFFEIVGKKGSREEFRNVIFDLLSPAERVMISKRIAIIYLLLKQIDHRTICNVLKVSNSTVSKFALLMLSSVGIVPSFRKILQTERMITFLEDFFNTIFAPGVPGVNWKAAWERKISSERKKRDGL